MESILGVLMVIWEFIKKNWKEVLIIVLGLLFFIQCSNIHGLKSETKRLSDNYYAMCDSASLWKTKSGALATKTQNMEVTIDELNALYGDAKDKIKELNIKIKDLESYQHGVIEKYIHDTITLHDTVVNGGIRKSGTYTDGCVTLDFMIGDSTMSFDMVTKDAIDILIASEKQGSWWKFWTWPRKRIYTTTATSQCPNTKVIINSCKIKE